jgi:hypothetical protein
MKKPQNLDEILDQLANLDTDKTNYDLLKIPFEDWPDFEHLHLHVPEGVNKNSVTDACLWLEEFYGFKERGFKAYITSDHHDPDTTWAPDPNAPSGFYFVMADTSDEDDLAERIYSISQKQNLAERPGYSKADAMTKASQILFEEKISEAE